MHDQPRGGGVDRAMTTAEEDAREERRVLREVLTIYPASFTLEELTRELTVGSSEYSDQDAIERAVRDLIGCGLLHRMGELVLPTRPAVVFYALIQEGEV
jgi:hypothetical protein